MGYSKEVYDRAWEELGRRKLEARAETQWRRERIHAQIPEVAEIEKKMAQQGASIARTVIANPMTAQEKIDQLAQQNLRLQERREELLIANGYEHDYLADQYACARCRDSGYRGREMCDCLRTLLAQEAGRRLSETAHLKQCSFENFSLAHYSNVPDEETKVIPARRMEEVYRFCRRWTGGFSRNAPSILMIGRTGLGKTHLSLAMAGEVSAHGNGVIYTPVQKMMDALEAEKFSRDTSDPQRYNNLLGQYLGVDLLVLDDLGTEFSSSFTLAALYNVINTRLVEGRPTIVNTNLGLPEIETRYSQRMVSRLMGGYTVLRFVGRDIRFIKKKMDLSAM